MSISSSPSNAVSLFQSAPGPGSATRAARSVIEPPAAAKDPAVSANALPFDRPRRRQQVRRRHPGHGSGRQPRQGRQGGEIGGADGEGTGETVDEAAAIGGRERGRREPDTLRDRGGCPPAAPATSRSRSSLPVPRACRSTSPIVLPETVIPLPVSEALPSGRAKVPVPEILALQRPAQGRRREERRHVLQVRDVNSRAAAEGGLPPPLIFAGEAHGDRVERRLPEAGREVAPREPDASLLQRSLQAEAVLGHCGRAASRFDAPEGEKGRHIPERGG